MPPSPARSPRFIADSSQDGIPHGRFAERLGEHFRAACEAIADLPDDAQVPAEIDWFPERAWGGRTWIPATARGEGADGPIEFFGHVSYMQPAEGDPADFRATADFTDVLAEDNPDWQIDLNDDVIGRWQGEAGMAGRRHPGLGPATAAGSCRGDRRARGAERRSGAGLERSLHPDSPRRPRGLRRRPLPRGEAVEPAGQGAGLGKPLRGGGRRGGE